MCWPREYKIYIVQCEQFFKIGYTGGTVRDRINNIRSHNPHEVHLLCTFRMDSEKHAKDTEKELHAIYDTHHVTGEWYKLDYECINRIKAHLKDRIETNNTYPKINTYSWYNRKEKYWLTRWKNTQKQFKVVHHKLACEKAKTKRLETKIKNLKTDKIIK